MEKWSAPGCKQQLHLTGENIPQARNTMKILQVVNCDFTLNKFLIPLVVSLKQQGHQVECVCEGTELLPIIAEMGIIVHEFEFPKRPSPVDFLLKIFKMKQLIQEGQYDLVNSHNRNASIITRVAAHLAKVPVNLYTARGFYFHDNQSRVMKDATIFLERILAKITTFTLSQSSDDVSFMVGKGYIQESRIKTIGNGINVNRFVPVGKDTKTQLEKDLQSRPHRFRICALGRLVKGKGFMDLLLAFAKFKKKVPNGELLLIGGNIAQDIEPFDREFRRKAKELGIEDDVVITGITDAVEKFIQISDVFVIPSYREGVPRALLEAMACGLPCIATNIRGCSEIVEDGKTGFLYAPKNIEQLIENLHRVEQLSKSEINLIRHAARSRVVDSFNEEDYIKKQVDAINSLLVGVQP